MPIKPGMSYKQNKTKTMGVNQPMLPSKGEKKSWPETTLMSLNEYTEQLLVTALTKELLAIVTQQQ